MTSRTVSTTQTNPVSKKVKGEEPARTTPGETKPEHLCNPEFSANNREIMPQRKAEADIKEIKPR